MQETLEISRSNPEYCSYANQTIFNERNARLDLHMVFEMETHLAINVKYLSRSLLSLSTDWN